MKIETSNIINKYPEEAVADTVIREGKKQHRREQFCRMYTVCLFIAGCIASACMVQCMAESSRLLTVGCYIGGVAVVVIAGLFFPAVILFEDGPDFASGTGFGPIDSHERGLMELTPVEFFCRKLTDGKILSTSCEQDAHKNTYIRYWYQADSSGACCRGYFRVGRIDACTTAEPRLVITEEAAILQIPVADAERATGDGCLNPVVFS